MANLNKNFLSHYDVDNPQLKRSQEWVVHPLPETTSRSIAIDNSSVGPEHFSSALCHRTSVADFHNTINHSSIIAFYWKDKHDKSTYQTTPVCSNPNHLLTITDLISKYPNHKYLSCPDLMTSVWITCSGKVVSDVLTHGIPTPCTHQPTPPLSAATSTSSFTVLDDIKDDPAPIPPASAANTKYDAFYTDNVAYRTVTVRSSDPNFFSMPPKSQFANLIDSKISDPTTGGALLNLTKAYPTLDVASVNAIAKSLLYTSDSWREERAIVCCALLSKSLNKVSYIVDATPMRYMRPSFKPDNHDVGCTLSPIVPTPATFTLNKDKKRVTMADWSFKVTTLDVVGQYLTNKYPSSFNCFPPSEQDRTWTMVPVTTSNLCRRSLVPYIQSFLHNEAWWGKVLYDSDITHTLASGSTNTYRYRLMPQANKALIPGPRSFLLVLVDTISTYCPSKYPIDNLDCRVVTNPSDIGDPNMHCYDWYKEVWAPYWVAGRLADMPGHCAYAYDLLLKQYSVMDVPGRALSLASELSHCWTYGGAINKAVHMDEAIPGLWSIDGRWLDNNKIRTATMFGNAVDSATCRRILIGKMFSELSPWHMLQASCQKLDYAVTYKTSDIVANQQVVDTFTAALQLTTAVKSDPDAHRNPQYACFTATSLYRLATVTGFFDKVHNDYYCDHSSSISLFLTGLACAHSLNTSWYLLTSKIPIGLWQGKYSENNPSALSSIRTVVNNFTVNICIVMPMREIIEATAEWGWNCIDDYYSWLNWDDHKWDICSPVSTFYLAMWQSKFGSYAVTEPTTSTITLQTSQAIGVLTYPADPQTYLLLNATSDVVTSRPRLLAIATGAEIMLWYEDLSPSILKHAENKSVQQTRFSSCVFTMPKDLYPLYDAISQSIMVDCAYISHPSNQSVLNFPPIHYPDPPSTGFLEKLRDYVIFPALAGGLGYLTGGPIGAVAGAGGTLLKNIQNQDARSLIEKGMEVATNKLKDLETAKKEEEERKRQTAEMLYSAKVAPPPTTALNPATVNVPISGTQPPMDGSDHPTLLLPTPTPH